MEKIYQISFDDKIRRDELKAYLCSLQGTGIWFFCMPNSLFISSTQQAADLSRQIATRFPGHGYYVVSEVPLRNCEGWLPKDQVDLVNAHRVAHSYNLVFDGYWLEGKEDAFPAQPGIYCVYACNPNASLRTVNLNRLLYVGKAENLRERHKNHEKKGFWRSFCKPGEVLCYSVAPVSKRSLSVVEAAIIYKHQPHCNDQLRDSFPHDRTRVMTSGCNALLYHDYVVG